MRAVALSRLAHLGRAGAIEARREGRGEGGRQMLDDERRGTVGRKAGEKRKQRSTPPVEEPMAMTSGQSALRRWASGWAGSSGAADDLRDVLSRTRRLVDHRRQRIEGVAERPRLPDAVEGAISSAERVAFAPGAVWLET